MSSSFRSCEASAADLVDGICDRSDPLVATPSKFNMESEISKSLEKEAPLGNHPFSGSTLNCGGARFTPVTVVPWLRNEMNRGQNIWLLVVRKTKTSKT